MSGKSFRDSISRCPCHWAIVYLLHKAGLQWAEIAKYYAEIPLRVLFEQLQRRYGQQGHTQSQMFGVWLRILHKNLQRKVKALVRQGALDKQHQSLLDKIAGETILQDYFGSCTEYDLKHSCEAVDDLAWVAQALEGDDTFVLLIKRYGKPLRGRIRVRVPTDAEAEEVYQQTWAEVWRKLPGYDPANGPFEAMLKYWAGIMIGRYCATHIEDTDLLSELEPEYENADSVWDRGNPHPSWWG